MMAAMLISFLAASAPASAGPKALLVAPEGNYVARALTALGTPHERIDPRQYRTVSPFDHDVIVWGFDQTRAPLRAEPEVIDAFVRSGGVLLAFRANEEDPWLPAPLARDKAYAFGKILEPEHPIFTTPHKFTDGLMREVHGGSIYRAFFDLGEGWLPLVSAGAEQAWDKTGARDDGEHYGIVELPRGEGRIILVQMIPSYHWFHDSDGDASCAGARFFENLVHYALSSAPARAASRPRRRMPEGYHTDLEGLTALPQRGDGLPLDDRAWRFTSKGPYTMKVDRRGVLTFTHADTPSRAGSFAQLAREIEIPQHAGAVTLRWYESDTYCGGRERILGGERHGETALENYKRGMRFARVLVNGEPVWEQDVLGRNPQPASQRVRTADITDAIRKANGKCELALRVEDREGSADEPFAIDVFFATVEVILDLRRAPAAEMFEAKGFTAAADGRLKLTGPRGSLATRHYGPAGPYVVAVRLRDGHAGQSQLRVLAGDRRIAMWKLTADDHRVYWAVSEPAELPAGVPVRIEIDRDDDEEVEIHEAAIIAQRLLAQPTELGEPPAAGGRGAAHVRFPLTLRETAGAARAAEVTAQGIPFPVRCLPKGERLRVTGPDGAPVPAQTRTVARWPDGSAKMLLLAFPATVAAGETATYTVEAGEGVEPVPVVDALTLSEEAGLLRIDTGAIAVTVSTTNGRVVDDVRRGGRLLKRADEVWELVLVDEHGRAVASGGPTVTETQIVDAGPLRALVVRKGSLADGQGTLVEYRMTLEATAGSDHLRLEATIINREDTAEVYLKRWSLQLARPDAARGLVRLGLGETHAANAGAVLYQHREDLLSWTGDDGARTRAEAKAPGFVRLPGMAAGTRWFWQRYPQAIRFEQGAVRFDFIPEPLDDGDLPMRWRDRMLERTDRYSVGGVGYPQSPGKMGLFRLAQGEALSQEMLFVLDGRDIDEPGEAIFAPLVARLRAAPDPAYACSTRAFGELSPADGAKYPRYETGLDGLYDRYLQKREKRREYGFENFGDDTFEWGYGPSYTYWSNSEYDHHHGFALQYVRSGDPKWWELCEETARHYRDVVVIHHAAPGSHRLGGPRHHNATSVWMPQHDEQYWIADHTMSGASAGHSWVEGMIDYWFLTGDPWAEEVLHELAEWYCDIVEHNRYGAGGQERGPGWTLIAISALTNAIDGERIRQAGWAVADWILKWQDPIRGVVSIPISEQPSYEGGTSFMHGIVGRGLGRWYDVTGDPRVKGAAVGIAEWITTEPMGEIGTFWYKQSPHNSRRYGATDQCLTALSYAYDLTGDPWFAEVTLALMGRRGPGSRSISWYPQTLAQMAAMLDPAEPTAPGDHPAR